MSQRQDSKDVGGTGQRRPSTNRRSSNSLIDFTEIDQDDFVYSTSVSESHRAAWERTQGHMGNIPPNYQTNLARGHQSQGCVNPPPFTQAPPTLAGPTNLRTRMPAYAAADAPGRMPILPPVFTLEPPYDSRMIRPMQSARPVNHTLTLPTHNLPPPHMRYPMSPPAPPPSAYPPPSAANRPPPCRGHPAPGWCWKCKWHYSSCAQIGHKNIRYCFHCMKSRPWDGVERRD